MRKFKKLFLFLLLPIIITASIVGYGVYWAFYDINRIHGGEIIAQSTSPDGTYTVKAYTKNGGATTSLAVRGELIFNKGSKKAKNIYWQYKEDHANITWVDDNTVNINGHTLNLPHDIYDYRRH